MAPFRIYLALAFLALASLNVGSLPNSPWGQVPWGGSTALWAADPEPSTVDFARDIRPILSDRCFVCHGPDEAQRSSELRLDVRESALEFAISLAEPHESELLKRIASDDPDTTMPPPDSKLSLSQAEKELLRQWIAAGAPYAEHWSFLPPRRVEPPQAFSSSELPDGWPAGAIDRFILRKLEAQGLAPSTQADPATLIRRVTLDLTGLPPTVAEVDAFLAELKTSDEADSRLVLAGAYERLVDRLLASEKFGEQLAVGWLDLARYADTYGYQSDRYRATWPWRDWVVKAFNENLPYDQFITWQLAGDLLPDATQEQVLATAFNRHHRQTNEGGSVDEEFRAEYVADRVNTFGATFLGLTLECCRCHDHKYDPLTQENYYQLSAFFNSIDESGLYSHFTDATPTPTLALSDAAQRSTLAALDQKIADLEAELQATEATPEQWSAWRSRLTDVRPGDHVPEPSAEPATLRGLLQASLHQGLVADYAMDGLNDGKLINRATGEADGKTSEAPEVVPGKLGQALKFSGENNATFSAGGNFTRDQAFSISLWIKSPTEFPRAVVFHRSRAWSDAGSRGYELLIEDGRLSAALIHFWPGNAIRIRALDKLALDTWTHVAVAYDGSSRAPGLKLLVDGEAVEVEIIRDKLTRQMHGGEANELALAQRFRDVGFKDGCIDELKVYNRELSPLEIKMLMLQDALPENVGEFLHNVSEDLLRGYLREQFPPVSAQRQALREQLATARQQRSELLDAIPEIMVMREMPEQRPTFVLERGAYDAPGKQVERQVPASIPPAMNFSNSPTRLDLAQWLTHPEHSLTARVAVNRFWQSLFGRGIVATSEDFGLQGASPSHPELLDWLARNFIDSGWNVKQLIKSMVMSAAYRQQSNASPELLTRDPENVLLAHGPASRLSAEMIRDTALAASGLLVDKLGGPPVKPYQPAGLWEEKSGESYQRDAGEGSRRRSLYTFWKRTSPPPSMMTFDASNREVCIVSRQVTMTPLQVLVLLNDPQLVEAAVALAERAMQNADSVSGRVEFIYRSLCSRLPSERELQVLIQLHAEQVGYFAEQPEAAEQLLTVGDHAPAAELDRSDLAALAVVAEGLMSYDEFLMKR